MQTNLFGQNNITYRPLVKYVGGKTRAREIIVKLIRNSNARSLASPFCGGGSVELFAAKKGLKVYASDLYEPLVIMYQEFLLDSDKILDNIHAWNEKWCEQLHRDCLSGQAFHNKSRLDIAALLWLWLRYAYCGKLTSFGKGEFYSKHPQEVS